MRKHEMKIEELTKEATSDVKSAIEAAYYAGYCDRMREEQIKKKCPHHTVTMVEEVLIRT